MGTPAPLHSGDVLPKVLPLAPSVSLERNLSPAMEAHVQAVSRELALKYHPAAFSGHSKCTGVENVRIDSGPQLTQDKGSMSEAKFFYVMIKVQTNKTGDFCCQTESVASALKNYVQQNTVEGVMVQSIEEEGRLLTLSLAIKFAALRDRMRLRKYLREEKVVPFLKARADLRATCTVTTPCEDDQHAIYDALRRMAAGGAGGQQHPHDTRIVLDTAGSATAGAVCGASDDMGGYSSSGGGGGGGWWGWGWWCGVEGMTVIGRAAGGGKGAVAVAAGRRRCTCSRPSSPRA